MKSYLNKIALLFTAFSALLFVQCEKGDHLTEWGIAKIAMPQASILDGGTTNNYIVPSEGMKNYELDTVANTISIRLGVSQSGKQSPQGFKVEVNTNSDTINYLVESEIIENAVLLPEEVYTLPETVTVEAGEREALFALEIDREKLIANHIEISGKNLLLAVQISNPSNYELDNRLNTTIVVIKSREFMPAPPIKNYLDGGDMEVESATFWERRSDDLVWGYTDDLPAGGTGGCLKWQNGHGIIYHEVNDLKVGKQYELSGRIKIPDGAIESWWDVGLLDVKPYDAGWGDQGQFIMGWHAAAAEGLDGDIREIATYGYGIFGDGTASGSNGVFTATKTTMYVFIRGACTHESSFLFDDIKVIKVE